MNTREIIIALLALSLGGAVMYVFMPESEDTQSSASSHTDEESETIYTCSMHPQVERDEPGLCPICGMELIPKSSTSSEDPLQLSLTEDAVRLSQLETAEVKGSGSQAGEVLSLSGHVKIDKDYSSSMISYFSGEIVRLYVKSVGEKVKNGQKVADIYAPELRIHQEELIAAARERDSAPDLYRAARRKLENWKLDSIQMNQIIEEGRARDILTIHSAATATVTSLEVQEGDMIRKGSSLLRISNLNHLWAEFEVPESDLADIQVGTPVVFSAPAVPNREFRGRIYYIDPQLDAQKRTAVARARVSSQGVLKPEMLIRGFVQASSTGSSDNLIIPSSAILWTGPRSVVYIELGKSSVPTYEYREVEVAKYSNDIAYITSGLEIGERVVTKGAFVIDAAAQLNNQKSMMNQMVGESDRAAVDRKKVNPLHQEAYQEVIHHYWKLKDAFVESDSIAVRAIAGDLHRSAQKVPSTVKAEESRQLWMPRQESLEQATQKIMNEDELDQQRVAFEEISNSLIFLHRHFKLSNDTLYVQHCPMAFDNEGADWISQEEKIRNPYFGDKMLKCGSVEEVFQ
jgi:Cu(I)/Ag(I) efflux system membrane fusion protein